MITMKRIFSIAVVLLATIVFCQGLMAQSGQGKNTEKPILPVPGMGDALAEYSANLPKYTPSGDQGFLMVKGPVVKGIAKINDGETENFGLDDNGWFIMSQTNVFTGETIKRGSNNRVVEAVNDEEDFDGEHSSKEFKYNSQGWLEGIDYYLPCGSNSEKILYDKFYEAVGKSLEGSLYSNENEKIFTKTVYTIKKSDPFHNWLERDVQYYENGRLGGKWHESRTLYYLSVIDKDKGAVATRPATGKRNIELINSKDGGIMYFHDGTKWRYCCIGNVKLPEAPKHEHKWKNEFEALFDYQTITWKEPFEPECGEHKHMIVEKVEGGVEERSFNVNVTNLPAEFTFKADNDRLVFVRKKELGNKYISKKPVSRGLWATLCYNDVAQFMYEPGDQSPAMTEGLEGAQRLVAEMNRRSEEKKERWEFMIATKQELDTLGIKYVQPTEDVDEVLDSEGGVYVVAVSKTSENASSVRHTYLLKYNITFECRRCGYKSLTYTRRMRYSNKERAERRWMKIKADVDYRNRNDQMEVDDPTLYREKDMKLYLVHYITWRECSICHAREPLTKNTFAFTDYSTASSFLADARMGKSVEELKKLAKGEAVEEQPESTEENDNSFATEKKKLQKGEIEGHEHEYKVTTSARRRTEKQGDKIFYLVDVTKKKTCWLCKHSEKVSTRTERFSTSREASEFYRSHMQNE